MTEEEKILDALETTVANCKFLQGVLTRKFGMSCKAKDEGCFVRADKLDKSTLMKARAGGKVIGINGVDYVSRNDLEDIRNG